MASYTYNLRNQISGTVIENGLFTAARSYDAAGRLTGVTHGTLDSTSYTLSADGRRTGINRNGTAETYGYDNARQVTTAAYPDLATAQSWNYDAAGNRSSATTNGVSTTYLANTVNQYTSITGAPAPPMYDANGNAISYPVRPLGSSSLVSCVFTWDINNQLITATAGTASATYQYDALGRRTKRSETVGGVTTHTWFFTNAWNVELEHSGSAFTRRLTWGLDLSNSPQGAGGVGGLVMVEMLPSGGGAPVPSFPTYDGNGNITAWVNASGTVVARQRYDAYGNVIAQTGTAPSNYGFSTKPQDRVTGLLYYGYRYYDPVTGRWPSRDPIEEDGGINLYGFVNNDGVNRWDLLGMKVECCTGSDIIDGKKVLVERYENYRKNLRKAKINAKKGWRAYCFQNEGASCSEQNEPIMDYLIPIPKCWECKLLNGSSLPFGVGDHWWVECKGSIDGRMLSEISFDAFNDVKGAGETETNRKKYPYGL